MNWKALILFLSSYGILASPQIGKLAPDFKLMAEDHKSYQLSEFKGKVVVLEWLNHGCPFVRKHYGSGNMQKLQKSARGQGVVWLSVISSAEGKQGYVSVSQAKLDKKSKGSNAYKVLLDPSGKVGKSYGAVTTPHMYIIDSDGKLVYRGAIDSVSSADPEDISRSQNYVAKALKEVLAGKKVSLAKTKPYGCSVKY
jgi:cytochrome oxidase Cu insertion factor (SCO1/SenC/PrrC family)